MKKLVFATQVFGLIAIFPIVVILEMNHKTGGSSKTNSSSPAVPDTEKTSILLQKKQNDKIVNETFIVTPEMFLLKKDF